MTTIVNNYNTFTFNEVSSQHPAYTKSIHRRFIANGVIQKVRRIHDRDLWEFKVPDEVANDIKRLNVGRRKF